MEHNIDMIRTQAETLIQELTETMHFDLFLSGKMPYYEWKMEYRHNKPEHISFASGCTRLAFWDNSKNNYVFKINMYTDDIDYSRQEECAYHEAEKAGVAQCFAWVHKVIEAGPRSIYAMPFCEIRSSQLSDELYEHYARNYCDKEGYNFEHLTDDQKYEVDEMIDGYSDHNGMITYVSEIYDYSVYDKLLMFIDKIDLNDLHCGNWGYLDGNLVIVDYAGYNRELVLEDAV